MERTKTGKGRQKRRQVPNEPESEEDIEALRLSARSLSFKAYGSGEQYNAPGGTQNINQGGNQFNESTFNGPVYFGMIRCPVDVALDSAHSSAQAPQSPSTQCRTVSRR
jgi:hypothetical protein